MCGIWTIQQLPTTNAASVTVGPTEFQAHARAERLANKQQMLDLLHSQPLGNAVWQIVNARSEKKFCGIDAQNNQ